MRAGQQDGSYPVCACCSAFSIWRNDKQYPVCSGCFRLSSQALVNSSDSFLTKLDGGAPSPGNAAPCVVSETQARQ